MTDSRTFAPARPFHRSRRSGSRPIPYDRVAALGKLADALPGGMVDCSIGTPCDRPADGGGRGAVLVGHRARLSGLGREPGPARVPPRPGSSGGSGWRRFPRPRWPPASAPRSSWPRCPMSCVCANPDATPCSTRPSRTRPTPWVPRWPDAGPSRCRRGPGTSGGSTWRRSPSPMRPAPSCCGRTRPPTPRAAWATSTRKRRGGAPAAFPSSRTSATPSSPGTGRPARSCRAARTAWWRSTRSPSAPTWPGCGSGFFAGDAELVEFLRSVRRHAGLMVPGPVQAAGAVALADDEHVEQQRTRYRERLAFLAGVLTDAGCPVELPEGGFYLWVPVPTERWRDAWSMAEDLARAGRAPRQSGRPLRRGGRRFRARRRRPADRAPRTGRRAPGPPLDRVNVHG